MSPKYIAALMARRGQWRAQRGAERGRGAFVEGRRPAGASIAPASAPLETDAIGKTERKAPGLDASRTSWPREGVRRQGVLVDRTHQAGSNRSSRELP